MSRKSWFLSVLVLSFGLGALAACSDDSSPKQTCGNGVCDPDEKADTCPVDCGCGNGVINDGEECDGDNLADQTCQSLGYQAGVLACSNHCRFDRSRCEGGTVCGNGLLEGGEECDGTDKGDKTCADFSFDGGELGCDPSCHLELTSCCKNSCEQDGATRCQGESVETCQMAETGCLAWQQTEDCSRRQGTCTEGDDGFYCKYPCHDRCNEQGAHLCDADILKVCDKTDPNDPEACLDWLDEQDCQATGQYCDDRGDGAACVTPPPGDTCLEPYVVTEFPFELSGSDITRDYTDRYDFSGTGCTSGNGVEAIFQIQAHQGDNLHVVESGSLDAVIRIVDTCDATAACLLSKDYPEDQYFEVPADGTYYVVLEAYSASPSSKNYDISIDLSPAETDCTDGNDNDNDGLTDCADPSCFGQTGCTTEAICDDGFDNDGDGLADCADPDCPMSNCARAVYQEFSSNDPIDLQGYHLTFTPDATLRMGYQWSATADGSPFPELPGSGDTSQALSLDDDDSYAYHFNHLASFTFYEQAYQTLYVISNGFITFEDPSSTLDYNLDEFLGEVPKIAGIDRDLDPSSGGTITVDEFSDRLAVTFEQVPRYNSATETVTFQIILHDDGSIDVYYGDIVLTDNHSFAGIADGNSSATQYPGTTNFVP